MKEGTKSRVRVYTYTNGSANQPGINQRFKYWLINGVPLVAVLLLIVAVMRFL